MKSWIQKELIQWVHFQFIKAKELERRKLEANIWTDNIFESVAWLKKKLPYSNTELYKMLEIPEEFDSI